MYVHNEVVIRSSVPEFVRETKVDSLSFYIPNLYQYIFFFDSLESVCQMIKFETYFEAIRI